MNKVNLLAHFLVVLATSVSQAHANRTVSLGIGFYSQNAFHEITKTNDGKPAILGATSFPLLARYEWNFLRDLFLSPTVMYTPLARKPKGNSYKVTMFQFMLPVGGIVAEDGDYTINWQAGPGFAKYTHKGKGGIKVLSNGSGSSNFAAPGRSVTVTTTTFNLGMSYNIREKHRFGLDLVFEGLLSSKRTQSLMLSYSHRFGGDQL